LGIIIAYLTEGYAVSLPPGLIIGYKI